MYWKPWQTEETSLCSHSAAMTLKDKDNTMTTERKNSEFCVGEAC